MKTTTSVDIRHAELVPQYLLHNLVQHVDTAYQLSIIFGINLFL